MKCLIIKKTVFACPWDDEHRLGVMLYKDRLVDIGYNEVATFERRNSQ